jgi:hypothetical protein
MSAMKEPNVFLIASWLGETDREVANVDHLLNYAGALAQLVSENPNELSTPGAGNRPPRQNAISERSIAPVTLSASASLTRAMVSPVNGEHTVRSPRW